MIPLINCNVPSKSLFNVLNSFSYQSWTSHTPSEYNDEVISINYPKSWIDSPDPCCTNNATKMVTCFGWHRESHETSSTEKKIDLLQDFKFSLKSRYWIRVDHRLKIIANTLVGFVLPVAPLPY